MLEAAANKKLPNPARSMLEAAADRELPNPAKSMLDAAANRELPDPARSMLEAAANRELPDLPHRRPVEENLVSRPPVANRHATNAPFVQDQCRAALAIRLPAENNGRQRSRREGLVRPPPNVSAHPADRAAQTSSLPAENGAGQLSRREEVVHPPPNVSVRPVVRANKGPQGTSKGASAREGYVFTRTRQGDRIEDRLDIPSNFDLDPYEMVSMIMKSS